MIPMPGVIVQRIERPINFMLSYGLSSASMPTERAYETIESMMKDIFYRDIPVYLLWDTAIEITPYDKRVEGWGDTSIINVAYFNHITKDVYKCRGFAFCDARTIGRTWFYLDEERNVIKNSFPNVQGLREHFAEIVK